MSAMDTESDQVAANDDVQHGKRKRSPREAWGYEQHTSTENSEHESPPGPYEEDTQPIRKRARPENNDARVESLSGTSGNAGTLQSPLLRLPTKIHRRILSHVDPFSLARVMRVCRLLHGLLDHRQDAVTISDVTSDSIWSNSRRLYNADLPYPLRPLNELGMLRLLFGKRCEICGRLPKEPPLKLSETPWNAGPGIEGVRAIWPLKVRCCADCLRPLLLKESDLAQFGSLHLEKALSPVSLTKTLNYVMSAVLKRTSAPPGLQLAKYYLRPQLHDLSSQDSQARASGNAVYKAWLETLDTIKGDHDKEVLRLEEWEMSRKPAGEFTTTRLRTLGRASASESGVHSDLHARSNPSFSGFYRPRTALSDINGGSSSRGSGSGPYPRPSMDPPMFLPFAPGSEQRPPPSWQQHVLAENPVSAALSSHMYGVKEASGSRTFQSSHDFSTLRAQKRADIERRCTFLNPPISLAMLERLPAFRAAVETLLPLNSDSWEVLKDHLLRQRDSEETLTAAEQDAASHTDSLDAFTAFRVVTPPDELIEEDLRRQALRTTREKLSDFAREFIRQRPAHGTNLTYGSAPQFAADILLYVRRRFYEEQAREDATYAMHGESPPDEGPSGARVRRLRLENMRFVFDTAVKPLTELVRKDLFLCNACEGKPFAFEAIIQHFASKHTDAFSRGTAVVYWKAEWPREPPFSPTPGRDGESNGGASHPPTSSHPPTQAPSLQPSRMASGAQLIDDHRIRWSDRSTHMRHDVESASRFPRHRDWQTDGDFFGQSQDTNRLRELTQPISFGPSMLGGERTHRHSAHSGSAPGSNYYRHAVDGGRHQSSYRNFSEAPEAMEVEQHGTVFFHDTRTSTVEAQGNVESRRALGSLRGYRDPLESTSIAPSPSNTIRHTDHSDRADYLTQTDGNASNLATSQFRLSTPESHHVEGSRAETALPRSREARATPASGFDSNISAADNFLNSFSPTVVYPYSKSSPRGDFVQGLASVASTDTYRSSTLMDRRSNISQPRKRGRSASDDEVYRQIPTSSTANSAIRGDRDHGDQMYVNPPYITSRHEVQSLSSASSHPAAEHRYLLPTTTRSRIYDQQIPILPEHEIHRDPYFAPVYRYVDRYGPELHLASPASPETRSPETVRYREVRYERSPRYDGQRVLGQAFERPQYERPEPTWDPEARRYYIQRPAREYLPEPRYVQYEETPDRGIVREDENRRYFRQASTRPPIDDPRYERR